MPLFNKKPMTVEAHQWTEENFARCIDFVGKAGSLVKDYINKTGEPMVERWTMLICLTPGQTGSIAGMPVGVNTMRVEPGDWIVRDVKGGFYPIPADQFELLFDPVPVTIDISQGKFEL